jgi:acyl-CoA thioester hydrolase
MKPTPARLRLDTYPHHKDVPVRFSDIDVFRHINNVATGQFYDEARFELLSQAYKVAGERGRLVIANFDVAYLREGKYPGTITVGSGIVRVGERSAVIGQALFLNGQCIGAADSVVVAVDDKGGVPIPEPVRAYFATLMLPQG